MRLVADVEGRARSWIEVDDRTPSVGRGVRRVHAEIRDVRPRLVVGRRLAQLHTSADC
jgi:hypothetical protein